VRWLITGAEGQLGSRLVHALAGQDAVGLSHAELDLTSAAMVAEVIASQRPDVVLNAAAYTAVDAAETDETRALAVNRDGPAHLAAALARHGGRLVHPSTDYVFAGDADRPYEVDHQTGPRTAYGRSKLAGELAVRELLPDRSTIVRTAWVYGGPGPNFVATMVRLEREQHTVEVVADQTGSPTYVADLADGLIALGRRTRAYGTLHYVNHGRASWFELARQTFRLLGASPDRVRPTTTDRFPRPAPRPAWSVLSTRAWVQAGLPTPRDWQLALAEHLRGSTAAVAGATEWTEASD
jgi:dTDP-4-dehydrorhamnose reductase